MDLKGQSVIVTGGASGLGKATAELFAAQGAKIAIFDLNADAAKAVGEKLGGCGFGLDVADANAAEEAVAKAAEKNGAARVLVNCAGIGPPKRVIGRDGPIPLGDFERIIRVNLIGTFNMIRLVATPMSKLDPLADGERGVIINTASIAAFEGQIGQSAYAASKGGIVGMTLPIAREFAQVGIRVVTIAPGLFLTPLMESLPVEAQKSLAVAVPFPPRLGVPAEYAQLAGTIVQNVFLNGETIRLDGALRMAPR